MSKILMNILVILGAVVIGGYLYLNMNPWIGSIVAIVILFVGNYYISMVSSDIPSSESDNDTSSTDDSTTTDDTSDSKTTLEDL